MCANRVEVERVEEGFLLVGFALVGNGGQIIDVERVSLSSGTVKALESNLLAFLERLQADAKFKPVAFPRVSYPPSVGVANAITMSTGMVSEICFGSFSTSALNHEMSRTSQASEKVVPEGLLRVECTSGLIKRLIESIYVDEN
jgi:hypothetical protein